MSIETEPTTGELIANEASASAKQKTAAARPKGAPAPKSDNSALREQCGRRSCHRVRTGRRFGGHLLWRP
jgi:hypothetical protein